MQLADTAHLAARVRDVVDFPKPGIVFKDITPLLQDPGAMREVIHRLAEPFHGQGISHVVGIESRGFIFGSALAYALSAGFVPVRKPGKLPSATHRAEYALEYGTDALEIHTDAFGAGDRVLIVDDVLATGGTARASLQLVRQLGADVAGFGFLIELGFLNGRERLPDLQIHSVLRY